MVAPGMIEPEIGDILFFSGQELCVRFFVSPGIRVVLGQSDIAVDHAGVFLNDVLPSGLCAVKIALACIQFGLGDVRIGIPG